MRGIDPELDWSRVKLIQSWIDRELDWSKKPSQARKKGPPLKVLIHNAEAPETSADVGASYFQIVTDRWRWQPRCSE
jgi:hypothetical protein